MGLAFGLLGPIGSVIKWAWRKLNCPRQYTRSCAPQPSYLASKACSTRTPSAPRRRATMPCKRRSRPSANSRRARRRPGNRSRSRSASRPALMLSRLEKHSVEPGRRPAIENAARTFTCKAAFASASALPVWELETRAGRHRHYQPQNGPSRQKPILETLVCTRGLALNRSLGALSFFWGSVGVATITALPANVGRGRYFANLSSLRLRGCWCCDRFVLCTLRSFPNYGTKHQTKNLGVRSSNLFGRAST